MAKIEPIVFEAVKEGQAFGHEGLTLKLKIDASEAPPELLATNKGDRFMVVVVKLPSLENDDEGIKAVQLSGILCKEESFADFLNFHGWYPPALYGRPISEENTADSLRRILHIKSRSQLRVDVEARDRFLEINRRYREWLDLHPPA